MLLQREEADALEAETFEALAATPERGADFAAGVRGVLADETRWVAWKRDAAPDPSGKMLPCASFQRPPYQEPAGLQKGRGKRPGGEPVLSIMCAAIDPKGRRSTASDCFLAAVLLQTSMHDCMRC